MGVSLGARRLGKEFVTPQTGKWEMYVLRVRLRLGERCS